VDEPVVSNPLMLKALSSAPIVSVQEQPRTLEQVYLKVMAEARGKEYVQ